jgi:Fic family protein
MDTIGQHARRIGELVAFIRSAPPSPALRGAFAALQQDEVLGSIRLSGARLDAVELRALTVRGRALGGHELDDYLLAKGYADAAQWTARRGTQRGPITTDDLRALHRRIAAPWGGDAGAWRTRTLPAFADGTVPPPHWLVPFETATYVGRLALADDDPAPLAVARAIARLVRLQPFPNANGRVARLVGNLVGFRRGLPPLVLDAHARRAYEPALHAALGGDNAPLAGVIARALIRALERLRDAIDDDDALAPLAEFAPQGRPERLYKAAQRGRLRVVRRDGRLLTTAAWVAQYTNHGASRLEHSPPTGRE